MAKYNNLFTLRDFFSNPKLAETFPQISESESVSDEQVRSKIRDYLVKALNGTVNGENIEVSNISKAQVMTRVKTLRPVMERFFSNYESLTGNLRINKKLYTSVASVGQIVDLQTTEEKAKYFEELLDNLDYNPQFIRKNSPRQYEPGFIKEQAEWKKRVGYRGI